MRKHFISKVALEEENMKGWIGCDLDGCLAYYDEWRGENHIGEPIPAMVDRVKQWLVEGKEVRIFTARVTENNNRDVEVVRKLIEDWSEQHIGQRLQVTNIKDYSMIVLYDDRCRQVEANTGRVIGEDN